MSSVVSLLVFMCLTASIIFLIYQIAATIHEARQRRDEEMENLKRRVKRIEDTLMRLASTKPEVRP